MAVSNVERCGSRTNPSLEALHAAFTTYLPHVGMSNDIFYNYCFNCRNNMNGVALFVTTSVTETNLIVAENFPHKTSLAVNAVNGDTVSVTPITAGNTGESFEMDTASFADSAYGCLVTSHTCRGDVPHPLRGAVGDPLRVDMSRFHRRRTSWDDHAMNVSALLRCPAEPFRTLDFDLILVDTRTRLPLLIIEESADAGKNTAMSETLARNLGIPVVKIITRDPFTGAAEITVWETLGRPLNAVPPRFASYRDFFEQWCVPNLA